ncbi:MAG: glycerol-3-phosphate dehydrogenase C-terminal domain-containing protein [Planctomycetota bacterium]
MVVGLVPAAVTMCNASALGAAVERIQDAEPQAIDEDDEMLQEMMILSIDRESAEYYADLMGFDDLQREIAMELYREYYGQYRDRAFTMRDAYGKIEEAIGAKGAAWTANEPLPGGDFPVDGYDALVAELEAMVAGMPDGLAARLARAYGTSARRILAGAKTVADLGQDFGAGLYAREVAYLADNEWATTADDILWRRSKLGLKVPADSVAAIDTWLQHHRRHPHSADAA